MKGGLSLLCAAAVALALLASTPAGAAAQAAKLLIFDTQLQSDVTVQWATTVSLGGKSLRATNDVKRATTDGYHEFDIPRTSGCGAISARTDLVWVQGYRSDGRCSRPTLDINSASTSTEGNVYCAETKYRSCSFWRCTCKTAFFHPRRAPRRAGPQHARGAAGVVPPVWGAHQRGAFWRPRRSAPSCPPAKRAPSLGGSVVVRRLRGSAATCRG
eukprot:TRINITY_DN2041_c0_g1_i7.p1 TRINITY_DN2041_c0_g1~~TRINITY_DN2041_c0_g1_i7.p1  ORF type:complete len:215 (-),score=44.28 TRINITY_DN2041_c0_g1_i7:115-759(-)